MRLDEILRNYNNEWLLIEVKAFDEEYNILDGEVLLHSPRKNDVYEALLKTEADNVAIEYVGEIPEDLALVL